MHLNQRIQTDTSIPFFFCNDCPHNHCHYKFPQNPAADKATCCLPGLYSEIFVMDWYYVASDLAVIWSVGCRAKRNETKLVSENRSKSIQSINQNTLSKFDS